MPKGFNLQISDFKKTLLKICETNGLPSTVTAYVLGDVFNHYNSFSTAEVEIERNKFRQELYNKNENAENENT